MLKVSGYRASGPSGYVISKEQPGTGSLRALPRRPECCLLHTADCRPWSNTGPVAHTCNHTLQAGDWVP